MSMAEQKKHEQESFAMQAALKSSERRFRALIEGSSDVICLINAQGEITYVSPSITAAMGYEPEQFLADHHHALDLVHPTDRSDLQDALSNLLLIPGHSQRVECRLCCQNGAYTWFEVAITNLLDDRDVESIVGSFHDITERKQLESARRTAAEARTAQAQEIISTLLDHTPVVLWSVNKQGYLTLSTGAGLERLGLKTNEVVGKKHAEVYKDSPEAVAFMRRALSGETFVAEVAIDGVWFETHYAPLTDADGQITGMVGVSTDITARKRTEEVLQRNQERLELAQQAAHIGTFEWNILTNEVAWTLEEEALYGLPAGGFGGNLDVWLRTLHPDDRERTVKEALQLAKEGRIQDTVFRIFWPDKSMHWIRSVGQVFRDEQGKPVRMVGINQDITEQHLAQVRLAQSEAKFRNLFESPIIGTFVSTLDGLFLEANDMLLQMLGYSREELQMGKIHRDTLTPPEYTHVSQEVVQGLRTVKFAPPYEKVYLHKNGTPIHVLIALAQLDDLSDRCIGFVLDISERKALERRKDAMIDMTSHELKTPVTSLLGYTHLLRSRLKDYPDPQIHLFLERMEAQLKKLTRLISDLLDLSKIQAGQLPYHMEPIDLDELVRTSVEEAQATTTTHQIIVEGRIDRQVVGDHERLGQVFFNLLSNAIKYSPHAKKVHVRIGQEPGEALISIQDFGIGIVEADQDQIFERFYRSADPLEQTYPGLGISLYLSRAIIQRHQGRLWVASHKGDGATFFISLPLDSELGIDG